MATYVTVARMDALLDEQGLAWSGSPTTADKETARARAQLYIDAISWPGRKTDGRNQDSEFPRSYMQDRDGFPIDGDTIPREIELGTTLLAVVEQTNPGTLSPSVTLNDLVKSEQVGQLRVEYRDGGGIASQRPVVTRFQDAIAPLLAESPFLLTRA